MALTTRKLRPWKDVQPDIQKKLRNWNSQRNADNVTIPYGLQLEHNLSHPNPVRCMCSQRVLTGDIFVANQGVGVTNQLYLWNIDADTNGAELKKYPVTPAMTLLKCIPKVHALVGYCSSDMTINIFTDMLHDFKQLSTSPMPTTVLSMAFLDDTDELVLGTVGSLLTFKLGMFDIRAKLVPSKPFITDLTRDQWVLNLQVDRRTRQLIAMCDDGVFFINYSSRMQERFLPNWHKADLSCCIAYRPKEYFITAATDGTMKVWNSIVFSQVHEFMGHYNHITGLALHPRYPLLVSGSRDGSIRVWRLDTLEQTYRMDIGDDILEMSMLGSGTIFYRTKHQIKVWYLNQFHSTFSHVYCSVNKLVRINWAGLPSRILVTGEKASCKQATCKGIAHMLAEVGRAVSGVVLNIIYPMATYQVLDNLVYDPSANRIFAVLKDGEVLVYDSSTNPCMPQQLLCPETDDEQVLSAALIKLELALGQEHTTDGKAVVFAGHKNGQLSLLRAPDQLRMQNIQAHSGQVSFLYSSHGKPGHGVLGSVSRLVSCGTDKRVHIWEIRVEGDTIRLICLSTVQCQVTPMLISMVGNILALVTIDGVLSMYKTYTKEEMTPDKTTYIPVSSCIVPLTHHIEDDHKKGVTALCCSRTLGLFATTGKDACVKIWNTENKLLKELVLDNTLQGVCFANDRGDLLIGYQSHVSYIPLLNYLPKPYLEELDATNVLDEELEEPVPYDPSLQLLFTMDSIPVFPLDLNERRAMELQEVSSSVPATQVSEMDLQIPLSTKTSSFLSLKPSSHIRQNQLTDKDGTKEPEKVEEEEDPLLKRKPIIAPDGYIPNSVIRFIIGYKPPPEKVIYEEWKLKAAPSGEESPSGKKSKQVKEKKEWEGPTLLRNIVNYSWFPRDKLTDQKLTVENVMAILLPLLEDTNHDKGVQEEALNAITTGSGVKTKQDLARMLQQVGVLKGPVKNVDSQNLKELEERMGKKVRDQALHDSLSEISAKIAMWNDRIDQRHAYPPLETDFLDFIDKEDQLDKKRGKQKTKGAAQISGKQKERGPPGSKAIRKMLIAKELEDTRSSVGQGTVTTTQDHSRHVVEAPSSSRSGSAADSLRHAARVTGSAGAKEGHREPSEADTSLTAHKLPGKEAIDDKSVCQDDDTAVGTDDAMSTALTDDVASTAPTVEELELRLRRTFTDDYAATESSYDDSGLGQMSDTSSYMDGFRVRKPMQTHYFPPIKSGIPFELRSDSDKSFSPYKEGEEEEETTEKWRQLFNRPSAQRRKRLYEERAKKLSGKGAKAKQSLPPIVYMKDMKQLTKGDLGQRLLLSVATHFAPEARKKLEGKDRHRITSLPHKLGSHTDVESYGCSNFGTINMLWTTMAPRGPEIPVLYPHNSTFTPTKDGAAHGQRQPKKPFRVPLPSLEMLTQVQAIQESGLLREKSLKQTYSRSYPSVTPYSWSTPLPPARKLNSTLRKLELSEVDLSAKPAGKERCVVHKGGRHRCKVCQGYYSSPELAGRPDSEEDPPTSAAPPPSRAEICKVISLPILA
ncbi:WD repeat-containing protein 87 [Branchiostoma belcheri]|nr:WD repeat-containing protein 87 [Branchiostoma belcheri]